MGSGTTIIESNLYGTASIGLDISKFNVMMCKVKTQKYDVPGLERAVKKVFEDTTAAIQKTNLDNFVTSKQKRKIGIKSINTDSKYLNTWFHPEALHTLLVFKEQIPKHSKYTDVLNLILSRTARSSRMIAHFEVDYPKKPRAEDYYCVKHKRTCHPTKDAYGFLKRYCTNTVQKIKEFQNVRQDVYTEVKHADSRTFNFENLNICDVFTSPPYLGLIDYHEQHRYAYELLNMKDNGKKEIGSRHKGTGKAARAEYKKGLVDTIVNITQTSFDKKNGKFIIVVNDRLDMYDDIVADSGMKITKKLSRKVERRSGRRAGEFVEDILICKVIKNG